MNKAITYMLVRTSSQDLTGEGQQRTRMNQTLPNAYCMSFCLNESVTHVNLCVTDKEVPHIRVRDAVARRRCGRRGYSACRARACGPRAPSGRAPGWRAPGAGSRPPGAGRAASLTRHGGVRRLRAVTPGRGARSVLRRAPPLVPSSRAACRR